MRLIEIKLAISIVLFILLGYYLGKHNSENVTTKIIYTQEDKDKCIKDNGLLVQRKTQWECWIVK